MDLFNDMVRIIGEVAAGKIERRKGEPYKDTGRTGIYLEIIDKDVRIYDPTPEDISKELNSLTVTPDGDNNLLISRPDGGFIQAIGSIRPGVFIRFYEAGGKTYQSHDLLASQKVQDILTTYLLSGCYPKPDTEYGEIKKGEDIDYYRGPCNSL